MSGHDARFVETHDAEAFVPADLPDDVDLPGPVWMVVSEANIELGRLDAAASLISNPQVVTRVATRREAIGTSALEGTYPELAELFAAEVLPFHEPELPSRKRSRTWMRGVVGGRAATGELRVHRLRRAWRVRATTEWRTPVDDQAGCPQPTARSSPTGP